MERRNFLGLAAGIAALGAGACAEKTSEAKPSPSPSKTEVSHWHKDPQGLIDHGHKSLETPAEKLTEFLTSKEDFFVRNNSETVYPKVEDYQLLVEGDGLEQNLKLSFEELKSLPQRTVFSTIECGGNQRAMFKLVKGKKAHGTQWKTGGVGNAVWTGVPLAEVLHKAGLKESAVDVLLVGLDTDSPEEGFRKTVCLQKALHPDTLLAYSMNGEALPPDHGFPLRAVVPGWVGSNSVKWLGKIEVCSKKVWCRNNTTSYTLIGDDYPPQGESEGVPCEEQTIKSALALAWPAELKAGQHKLLGYAHSPSGKIKTVEWSQDGGKSWTKARLLEPQIQHSWARFEIAWEAGPGEHQILTRATDEAGNTQPDSIPHNEKGYLFNQVLPHPVVVS